MVSHLDFVSHRGLVNASKTKPLYQHARIHIKWDKRWSLDSSSVYHRAHANPSCRSRYIYIFLVIIYEIILKQSKRINLPMPFFLDFSCFVSSTFFNTPHVVRIRAPCIHGNINTMFYLLLHFAFNFLLFFPFFFLFLLFT